LILVHFRPIIGKYSSLSFSPVEIYEPTKTATNTAQAIDRQSSNWDLRNAPKNYVFLVLFQFGSAFFSFASVWLITRNLGSEGYGGFIALIAASQAMQLFLNWSSFSVTRFGVQEYVETLSVSRTFWTRFLILVVNLAIVIGFGGLWFPLLANWLHLSSDIYWLIILHLTTAAFWVHVQMSLHAVKMPRTQGFLLMGERFLVFVSLLILSARSEFDLFSIVVPYVVAPVLSISIGIFQMRKFVFSRFEIDKKFVMQVMFYSVPLAPVFIVSFISGSYLDAIFISHYLSIRDLGVYSIATQINGILLQLPTLANSLLVTLFITLNQEKQTQRVLKFFNDLVPTAVLFWGILCASTGFLGWLLIPLVFGKEFSPSAGALWILLASTAISLPIYAGYQAVAQSRSESLVMMAASISAAVANIIFNFLLIPKYGLTGCAWATVAACFVHMATYGWLLRKRLDVRFSWTFTAMVPVLGSALIFTQTQNALISLIVFAILSVVVGFVYQASIVAALELIRNIVKRR